jgi:ubiquinone/menaquinone biosynthesis C-methylase UbiE
MEYTGERMVPEAADLSTFWEHVFRYAFACKRVKGRRVLDIASGEGYGTHALSKAAKSVIGVDISPEAIEHARKKYGLDFRLGSADSIPIASSSVGVVVSFETIEHVPVVAKFVDEVFRVLEPGGVFIVSTPNKERYLSGQKPNPYHCSELTRTEFVECLQSRFEIEALFGQVFEASPLDQLQRIVGTISNTLGYYLRRNLESRLMDRYVPVDIESNASKRRRIVESIPRLAPPLGRFWNRFAVRRLRNSSKNQPIYFVAVAARRGDARSLDWAK